MYFKRNLMMILEDVEHSNNILFHLILFFILFEKWFISLLLSVKH